MEYDSELIIDLPRDRVIALFDNQDNIAKWQKDLESFEHLEGDPGKRGAKSRLTYNTKGKKLEMTETITTWNPPDELSAVYEAGGMWNEVKNFFYQTDEGKTRWLCANEFRMKGFYKLMGILLPGMFKRQTLKYMKDFKNFAEREH